MKKTIIKDEEKIFFEKVKKKVSFLKERKEKEFL